MPTVFELALDQRRALLAGDAATAERLIRSYAAVDRDLQARLAALTDLIELRRLNGETVSPSWLQSEERFQSLIEQVEAETRRLAEMTGRETRASVEAATYTGERNATELIAAGMEEAGITVSFNTLPKLATEAAASALSDESPLARLIERITAEMPLEAVKGARDAILVGVSTGAGPRVVASNFRTSTGASLTRSLRIARTEGLRAYRQAALQTYQEAEVVESWQWLSTKSLRSCAACLALDGRVFPKDEPFAAHVNCRCSPIPVLSGGPRPRKTAAEWFAEQGEEEQERVLGKEATALYRSGKLDLMDFVRETNHSEWGKAYVQRGVVSI
jgi:SPP1 gp7 family putative phage head morphogenesis protein